MIAEHNNLVEVSNHLHKALSAIDFEILGEDLAQALFDSIEAVREEIIAPEIENISDVSNYVKPFNQSEVPNVGLANVSSISLVDRHQLCIEILEGIRHFEDRKKYKIERVEGFAGTFPELRRKYVNDIDTINRCIKRLEHRYKRVLKGC